LIRIENTPSPANLKRIKKLDPYSEMDDEKRQACFDFIKWYLSQEHLTLQSIPKPEEPDFQTVELDEEGNNVSAFNTHDFERLHPFNKYHYKLKKIYERLRDLAITHSCLSNEDGKNNTYQRFKNIVEIEFRDEAVMLLEHYKKYSAWMDKHRLIKKIEELNSKIRKCKEIWRKYAYWE